MEAAQITALTEAAAVESLTRRDGIVWHHTATVRPGTKCPLVVDVRSCAGVKKWAQAVAKSLASQGLRVHVGKCVRTYGDHSTMPDGWRCLVSILGGL